MTTREEMLDRVRKALGRQNKGATIDPLPPLELKGVMPPVEPQDYQSKFEAEWQKVGGIPYCVASMDELEAVFQKVLVETEAVTLSRNPLLAQLRIAERLVALGKLITSWDADSGGAGTVSLPGFNKASFAAGAGITGADYVLAESGSLVLTSATEGAQVASLAPPMHIALYRRSQLVGSLDEVLAKLPISNSPDRPGQAGHPTCGRSVVIVTGTSRTADIEQILIRGVHGPREAHAILVEDSCR